MNRLEGKIVIVTGASSGIGEATARRLSRSGARLVLAARRAERLDALAAEIDPSGKTVATSAGDIASASDRARLVATTLERFGRIDVLVNNAGYGQRGPLEPMSLDALRRNFEVNVFSLVALTQLVVPHLRTQGHGRIVNVGSVAGRIARPLTSVYDSTKHALEALTDGFRGELAPFNIQVVMIRPGYIATEFVEAARNVSTSSLDEAGPYAPYMGKFRPGGSNSSKIAAPPDAIARLIECALAARRPRTHYAGPAHAKLFLFARWLLPVRTMDWFVRMRRST